MSQVNNATSVTATMLTNAYVDGSMSYTDPKTGIQVNGYVDNNGNQAVQVNVPGLSASANNALSAYFTMEWTNGGDGENRVRVGSRGGAMPMNWLVAIARAMGQDAGRIAAKMVDLSNQLSDLAGTDSAEQFNAVAAELQGWSQMFNIMSQTESTVIKGLGEGAASIVRKT